MPILKTSNPKTVSTISGVTSSNVSSSLSGNMDLIQAQINEKTNDYINIRNAVKILEKYTNWNGYIKLYTEVENNFEVDDVVYITYTETFTGITTFNLENSSDPISNFDEYIGFTFKEFYNGYKILYTNPYKNEIVINRHYNDIPSGSTLDYQYLSKVSCRNSNFFNDIADGAVFYNCNVLNSEYATISGYVYSEIIPAAIRSKKYKISYLGISGATILLGGLTTISDINGYYSFSVPIGSNYLKCNISGFITYNQLINIVNVEYVQNIIMISGSNSIQIQSNTTSICSNNWINFTSQEIGYTALVTYQWKINGINFGSNVSTFSYNLFSNNDVVTCVVSDTFSNSSTSNSITITILPSSLSITVSPSSTIYYGDTAIFNTNVICYQSPTYQWKVNEISVGTNSSTYSTTSLNNNDIVKCYIGVDSSNEITMDVLILTTTTTIAPITTTTTISPVTTSTTTIAGGTTTTTISPVTSTTTHAATTTTTTIAGTTTTTTTDTFVGDTYYVSNTGNDALDGKSEINAWQTISKVNTMYASFSAGDRVLFNKGDTWREMLTINRSGAAGSYMYIGNYGTGNLPRILASKTTTWTLQSGNIWKSDITFTNPDSLAYYSRTTSNEHSTSDPDSTDYQGSEIYFELIGGTKEWGHYRPNTGSLTGEYQWCWTSSYMYIYCPNGDDPNSIYTAVEIPQREHIIDLNYKNYVQLSGLALLYAGMDCISYSASNGSFGSNSGLIVEYCEIAYVSTKGSGYGYGIEAPYSTSIFRHNEFHDCGRRAISLHLAYSSGIAVTNVLIEDNYFHDGWHTTGPDFNVGRGTSSISGVIVRRNKFYDPTTAIQDPGGWDWSEHMFFQNYNYTDSRTHPEQLQNFYIYSNIFISPKANSLNIESGKNINVWNNTFYNHNDDNTGRAHLWVDVDIVTVNILNNIFYTNKTNDAGGGELFLRNGADLNAIISNGNLYYRINTSTRIVEDEGTMYHMNDIALIRSNLTYEQNSPTPANPNFVSAPTNFNVQTGSTAINAGVYFTDANFDGLDYEGNAYANPPTIGAFEY